MIIKHDFGLPRDGRITSSACSCGNYLPETATRLLLGFNPVCHSLFDNGFFDACLILSMIRFLALQPKQFAHLATSLVMSPLVVAGGKDAMDIAAKLEEFGFCGRYLAFVSVVPSTSLIAREIRLVAPNVDFELIELSKTDINQPVFRG